MIKTINDLKGKLIAVYISDMPDHFMHDKTNFVTHPEYQLQVGFIHRISGTQFPAHQHPQHKRTVSGYAEVLIIKHGMLQASIYDERANLIALLILKEGDVFIQYSGGHDFLCQTEVEMIEIKQGPYLAESKIYIDPLEHEQSK